MGSLGVNAAVLWQARQEKMGDYDEQAMGYAVSVTAESGIKTNRSFNDGPHPGRVACYGAN